MKLFVDREQEMETLQNEYEREGYVFDSWNTKPDGTGISFSDEQEIKYIEQIENDYINLYAQWVPKTN